MGLQLSECGGADGINTKFGMEYSIFLKRDFTIFTRFSKTPATFLLHTLIMHDIEGESPSPSNTCSLESRAVYYFRRWRTNYSGEKKIIILEEGKGEIWDIICEILGNKQLRSLRKIPWRRA